MPIFDTHVYLDGYILPGINQNAAQVAQLLQARGIERALLFSSRAARVDPLSGNRILKVMLDQGQGLYGCLVAHLNRVDASLQAIRDLMSERRFLGVMLTSTHPDEPLHPLVADEVLNACRRYQKPIFLGTPNAACVEVALQLAKTYSMHKFVFLGMGGADWRTGIAAADQATNIYLELSGALDLVKIPAAIEAIGAHRLLFGSGSPYLDPAAALGLIQDSNLSPADQRRILHDNAAKLFNLNAIEAGE
ncbi:MAG TPA: amidohydrolase family protein [Chthonomonadaceae bacterium]|nr:amidohydrolase family protein [Chthonomonadaceae bacterium]